MLDDLGDWLHRIHDLLDHWLDSFLHGLWDGRLDRLDHGLHDRLGHLFDDLGDVVERRRHHCPRAHLGRRTLTARAWRRRGRLRVPTDVVATVCS